MTATSGFDLHPEAAQDITEIWEDIASDNPAAAGRVRNDILQGIKDLVLFPRSGHRRRDLTGRPLRFKRVRDYLIAYAPEELERLGPQRQAANRRSRQKHPTSLDKGFVDM